MNNGLITIDISEVSEIDKRIIIQKHTMYFHHFTAYNRGMLYYNYGKNKEKHLYFHYFIDLET